MLRKDHEDISIKLAIPGSTDYYCTVFLPHRLRLLSQILFAIKNEIDQIVREYSDQGVARIKLAWWQEEIHSTSQGQEPRHPLTQILCEWVDVSARHNIVYLAYYIAASECRLGYLKIATKQELILHFKNISKHFYRCYAALHFELDSPLVDLIINLGIALDHAEIFKNLRMHLLRGFYPIAEEDLESHHLLDSHLLQAHRQKLTPMLKDQLERLQEELERTYYAVLPFNGQFLTPLKIKAKICLATLQEIENDGCLLLEHRIALTPLRKLWIAWRNQR